MSKGDNRQRPQDPSSHVAHKARWEFSQRANGSKYIAILIVDWFSTGTEDETVFVEQAKDTTKGSYLGRFEGQNSIKKWQFVQLPKAEEMLAILTAWQNRY